jgi:MFS family permease
MFNISLLFGTSSESQFLKKYLSNDILLGFKHSHCLSRRPLTAHTNLVDRNGATIAMPAFDFYFGHYNAILKELYLDSIWTSLWSSMSNVGSIVGSAIAGPISQRVGRRYTGIGFGAITAGRLRLQPSAMRLIFPDCGCCCTICFD